MISSLKQSTTISLIALILAAVVTYFLAMPQAVALKSSRADLIAKKVNLKSLKQKRAALELVVEKLPQYEAEITKLAIAYPEKEQTVEALIQAQALTEKAGMSVGSLAPSTPLAGSLPISLTVSGGYEQVGQLFKEINDNLRPIKVDTISLLAANEGSNGVLSISLGLGFLFNGSVATTAPAPSTSSVDPTALPVNEPLPTK